MWIDLDGFIKSTDCLNVFALVIESETCVIHKTGAGSMITVESTTVPFLDSSTYMLSPSMSTDLIANSYPSSNFRGMLLVSVNLSELLLMTLEELESDT